MFSKARFSRVSVARGLRLLGQIRPELLCVDLVLVVEAFVRNRLVIVQHF